MARDQASLLSLRRNVAIPLSQRLSAKRPDSVGPWERELNMALVERLGDISKKVVELEGDLQDAVRRQNATYRRPSSETGAEGVNNLIQRVAGASLDEIDRVIGHLEQMRETLRREGERVQREIAGYGDLSQAAMSSVKIIKESLAHWHRPELPDAS